jgi:hypothetical protein
MLIARERRPAFRTVEGRARGILLEADAIRECETHGWMQYRADPHAGEQALLIAREEPLFGLSPEQTAAAVQDVLDSIGDSKGPWTRILRI